MKIISFNKFFHDIQEINFVSDFALIREMSQYNLQVKTAISKEEVPQYVYTTAWFSTELIFDNLKDN